jgi:Polyketide cyclase / dehydrase and lipid transport
MRIATARADSTAPPSAFFARWADMATWPQWNTDTEWVRLDGPFAAGSTGQLKPKGGPKVTFVIETLVPDREFVDVSRLLGARLTFAHEVSEAAGRTQVDVTVAMTGPLGWLWTRILGKGLRGQLQGDLDRLVEVAENDVRSSLNETTNAPS